MLESLIIDPEPMYSLSPNLYMQFMEPLGATDRSVEAAWDHLNEDWRPDVVDVTRELAPPLMRFGGCFSSYYRWREGVGPRKRRRPMRNLLWGGIESNQVGTHEFVDFCRRTGAEPFFGVNFESDGRTGWARPPGGGVRCAGPAEAAAWVDYCNNPKNQARINNGARVPFDLKLWQIGNETSYNPAGYDCETAARRTVAFARAMRKADPDIKLIAWGDSGWANRMLEVAGEYIDMIAFHDMFNPAQRDPDSPLKNNDFRRDPAATWEHLMNAWKQPTAKIQEMREQVEGRAMPLALTECHFALSGRSRCEVLSSWAAGVANARILNVHERNGDLLEIATLADFCGTAWQVNAIMIPVARVMALYRRHSGDRALAVQKAPPNLDVTASRKGRHIFVHVVNTNRIKSVSACIHVVGLTVQSSRVFEIAAPPEVEIMAHNADILAPVEKPIPINMIGTFPPASVSAVEINIES